MVSFYKGNESGQVPGLLPYPPDGYYWWQAGAMFGALISYWFNTGDTTYNAITQQAILFQVGPDIDFMPLNQTTSLGNDDQAFWAMTALSAAEYNFPNPGTPGAPSWLGLAQAVFNEQIMRWDNVKCNGGLRWQAVQTNKGYNLKNTISNGALFNIAARLARYTNDPMYADWATKIWTWIEGVGFIDPDYRVYDSADADMYNCTKIDHNQWSYNVGIMLSGAATMFNYVSVSQYREDRRLTNTQTKGDPVWQNRTAGLLSSASQTFFVDGGIMREGCENPPAIPCNQDQKSFKAYLARWMTVTTQLARMQLFPLFPAFNSYSQWSGACSILTHCSRLLSQREKYMLICCSLHTSQHHRPIKNKCKSRSSTVQWWTQQISLWNPMG